MGKRRRYIIIVAGGKGERMGADKPKQFLEIAGKPILRRTMERFISFDPTASMTVVLPSAWKNWWKEYCTSSAFRCKFSIVSGGITRFHSVQNALKMVPSGALVAIHDGVRPLVSDDLLKRIFEAAEELPAVIPAVPAVDSLRILDCAGGSSPVDRSRYVAVQTPQIFHSEVLKEAYGKAYSPSFTDDASVVEAAGFPVTLVPGERTNLKITTFEDIRLAGLLTED